MKNHLSHQHRLDWLRRRQREIIDRENAPDRKWFNGLFERYFHPVVTAEHVPLHWRYDLNPETNPHLIERLGVDAVFNAGAIERNGRITLACRIEGYDRKSFFGLAESENGTERFEFIDPPIELPPADDAETNVYDMRLVQHEDGWIYGLFCAERRDPKAAPHDLSRAVAACGIARTRDLVRWERLPDLKSRAAQQRNVVLHPEFVNGRYALYTRPQDDFIEAGRGGGIGWALCESMERAAIEEEKIIEPRAYHTIKEGKNGLGPAPLKTAEGWLHLAHGVRNTAAGLRYVLYLFLCDLGDPSRVIRRPGGYFMSPVGGERVGDVSNVLFSNGWVARPDGTVLIYYASSDTRLHVATSSIERLLDYVRNTPEDSGNSHGSVRQRCALIRHNGGACSREW